MNSTDTKNIKKIVQGILTKHGVVDSSGSPVLVVEIDLVAAWVRYMNEREEGLTPAESRAKITQEYGVLGFAGVSNKVMEKMRMSQLIMNALGLNVDESRAEWDRVINFCLEMEAKGQSIVQYQKWRDEDIFNSPKSHQIAQRPQIIIDTWPQAFMKVQPTGKRIERLNG